MIEDDKGLGGSKGANVAQKDSPMRWALGPDGIATHIFSIPPEKTGSACECTCPGCQEPLQAVNARLNVPGTPVWSASRTGRTMSQFFRHPSGHSRTSCLQKASQLATLTLFKTFGLIEVPAPISRQRFQGVSGKVYESEMRGQQQSLLVRRSAWIDHQRASLTLESGRKVLVVLESSHQDTSDQDFDGVISVRCDDPEIAGLTIEEILDRVVLSEEHTCWVRHWEDGELKGKALEQAKADAIDALDWISDEAAINLRSDVKLTSESLLHLVIKHIIAQAGYIITPDFIEHIPYRHHFMRDEVVRLPGAHHTLQNVRLEHALPGMVPDVYCDIVENSKTYPLAIEVFVTHGISAQKLSTIKAMNLRCLEVDVARFKEHGQLSIGKLRELVLNDPSSKAWKHHPDIDSALDAAHARIKEHDARVEIERAKHQEYERRIQAQEAQRLQEIASAKAQYKLKISSAPVEVLPAIFKDAVVHYLTEVKRGKTEECFVVPSELAVEMRRAGYDNAGDRFFWNLDGTMTLLMSLAWGAKLPPTKRDRLVDQVFHLYNKEPSFFPLVLRAIKRFGVQLTSTQEQKLDTARRYAWESIKKGESKFARHNQYDSLIGVILPVLLPDLAEPEGTLNDVHRRQSVLKHELNRERAQKQSQALEHARNEVDLIEWTNPPLSAVNAYRIFTSWEVESYCIHSMGFSSARSKEVIDMAYEESKLGGPIRSWVEWVGINSATDVLKIVELARKLKLI